MIQYQLWCFVEYAAGGPLLNGWLIVGFYDTHADAYKAVDDLAKAAEESGRTGVHPSYRATEYKLVQVHVTAKGIL